MTVLLNQVVNFFANVSVTVAAFAAVWFLLRKMDKSNDLSFKTDIWPEIKKGNLSMGFYYGMRVAGALVTVGLLFSRIPR